MDNLLKLKGYFIFAVDGSKINLPNTSENIEYYGAQANQTGQQAQAGLSCCFDSLNKVILDCTINRITFSEREEVERHIAKVPSFIGDHPFILVLDRGYPSSFLFMNRLEKRHKFVVRLSSNDFRQEQQNMQSDDEDVEIVFTPQRINPYRRTALAERLKRKGSIHLRFVKIKLPGGAVEFLATNLSRDEFSKQEIGEIYGLRWGIETAYDVLKNNFMLENFSGKKPIIIEQDIFSTVYLYNLTQDMVRDAEKELQLEHKNYKHKMKININTSIGIIKEDLIRMALEKSSEQRGKMFVDILRAIARNLTPIRENRQYPRKKRSHAVKYPTSKKRSY